MRINKTLGEQKLTYIEKPLLHYYRIGIVKVYSTCTLIAFSVMRLFIEAIKDGTISDI